MADIGEPFSLCKVFKKNSLVGIAKHCEENHVIVTLKDRGVLIYNVVDNKVVHSLPVHNRKEFTSAVVQDPHTRKFIGTLDNTKVCQWSEEATDVTDCQEIQVRDSVAQVYVCTESTHGPVLLFQDGSISLLSKCQDIRTRRKGKPAAAIKRLHWSGLFHYNGIPLLGVITTKDQKCFLNITQLTDTNSIERGQVILQSTNEGAELLCCCLQESNLTLVTYWSDGCLCTSDVKPILDQVKPSPDPMMLPCRCIHKIDKPPQKQKQLPVTMAAVDSCHICLCSRKKADNGSWQDSLSIYDTKFGTCQSTKSLHKLLTLQAADLGSATGPSGAEHMLATDGYVCVGVGTCVSVCPYRVEQSSLATALGKLSSTNSFVTSELADPLLCIPKLPRPNKNLKDWVNLISTEQSTEQDVLNKLTNPSQTSTLEDFSSELEKYLDYKWQNVNQEKEKTLEKVKKSPFKAKHKYAKGKFLLSQHFLLSVLSRCLQENAFWPRQSLSHLIQTRCIPGSSSPDLLRCLIEKNEVDLLLLCFKHIQGIPESFVVTCLQYALSAEKSMFTDENGIEQATETGEGEFSPTTDGSSFGEGRTQLLCHILSYPVNDVFIQESLKKLTTKSVTTLLKFLAHIVQAAPRRSFSSEESPLQYASVLDWTGWLMNSHYTSLVLMPDVHELLLDLHDSVESQMSMFQGLRCLDGFLMHFKNKLPLPETRQVGLYSVEMIEL